MDASSSMHPLDFGGGRVGWEPMAALHVGPTDHGTWRVGLQPEGHGTEHADREGALAAARRASRRQWEATGEPCLLRVHEQDGTERVLPGWT
jgi:hypothetical protein